MTRDDRSRLAAVLATVVCVALAALFLLRFRPALTLLATTARSAAVAAVVLAGIAACGGAALKLSRRIAHPDDGERNDPWPDCVAVGFVVFGTLAGLIALVSTAAVPVLAVAAAAAGAWTFWRRPERWQSTRPAPPAGLPLALLAIAVGMALLEAITPVNSPDEMVYKLAIPHQWQLYGRMVELPLNSNSYLAMALQSADLAPLIAGGGVAAKLTHFGLYLAVLAIAIRTAGVWTAVVLAWTPALMVIAGWSWSEWGVLGLLLLSYLRHRKGDWSGAAVALGCAVAAKYTALPWVIAYGLLLVVRRAPRATLIRSTILIAFFGGFFYVRNLVWSGSPIAPLLLPDAPQVENYRGSALGGLSDLLTGADIFDPRIVDESLGILLPLCAIAGLFAWRFQHDLVLLGITQLPIFILISPGSRNMINGVLPLVLAGMAMLEVVLRAGGRVVRVIAGGVGALAFAAQLVLVAYVLEPYEWMPYLAGRENGTQYIARMRSFAAPYTWIANNTAPDARALLVGENRTFHLQRQALAGGNLDGPRLAAWLSRFPTAEALFGELRRQRVTHVLLHKPWYRIAGAPVPPLTMIEREYVIEMPPRTHAVLSTMLNQHSVLRYRDREYLVYELR